MKTGPLDFLPLELLFALFVICLGLGMELGYRLGRWRHAQTTDEKEQPVGAMVASILGLLALVLGFTFSLAASRFDARRMAVLEEANAIGTTALRARLLHEPQRSQILGYLREYANMRVKAVQQGGKDAPEALTRSEELHELLWQEAGAAAAQDNHSIVTGIFIQSLNEVIDLHATRILLGMRSRIPLVIWIGLYGLAFLGMTSVGYQAGLWATSRSPAMLALVLAFSVVLLMIADLDRGQEGLLQVSQQAMIDLAKSLETEKP